MPDGDRDHHDPEHGQPTIDPAHEHRVALDHRPQALHGGHAAGSSRNPPGRRKRELSVAGPRSPRRTGAAPGRRPSPPRPRPGRAARNRRRLPVRAPSAAKPPVSTPSMGAPTRPAATASQGESPSTTGLAHPSRSTATSSKSGAGLVAATSPPLVQVSTRCAAPKTAMWRCTCSALPELVRATGRLAARRPAKQVPRTGQHGTSFEVRRELLGPYSSHPVAGCDLDVPASPPRRPAGPRPCRWPGGSAMREPRRHTSRTRAATQARAGSCCPPTSRRHRRARRAQPSHRTEARRRFPSCRSDP